MAREKRLTRHNVLLFAGDMDRIQALHPGHASLIMRALVRKFLIENKPLAEDEINLDTPAPEETDVHNH